MITFKKIQEQDQEFITKVYRSTREKELDLTNWPEDQKHRFTIMQMIAQLTDYEKNYKGATYEMVLYKKKPAGRLYLWETNNEIRIMDLSLLPEFQGKGIGRDILAGIVQSAKQKKKIASLHVIHGHPSKRMYERVGFKKVSETATHEYMEYNPV